MCFIESLVFFGSKTPCLLVLVGKTAGFLDKNHHLDPDKSQSLQKNKVFHGSHPTFPGKIHMFRTFVPTFFTAATPCACQRGLRGMLNEVRQRRAEGLQHGGHDVGQAHHPG